MALMWRDNHLIIRQIFSSLLNRKLVTQSCARIRKLKNLMNSLMLNHERLVHVLQSMSNMNTKDLNVASTLILSDTSLQQLLFFYLSLFFQAHIFPQ